VPDKGRSQTNKGAGQTKVPDEGRYRTNGGAGQIGVLGPAGCGLSIELKYSPRKNSTVSELGGHNPENGPKRHKSEVEKDKKKRKY
jgi:hypothetical protein